VQTRETTTKARGTDGADNRWCRQGGTIAQGRAGRYFTYSRAPDSLASPSPLHPNSLCKGNTFRRKQVPRGSRQEEIALGYVVRNRALGHPVCDGDLLLALPRRDVVVVAFVETLEGLGNHGSEVIQISSASQAWQVWVVPRGPGTIGTIDILVVGDERHLVFNSLALVHEAAVLLMSAVELYRKEIECDERLVTSLCGKCCV
jgi:hypothetical protein